MALFGNLGGLISNTLGSFGNLFGGNVGSLLNVGSSVVGSLIAPQAPAPIAQAPPQQVAMATSAPRVAGTMNLGPVSGVIKMAGKGLTAIAAGALIKIAQVTGRRTMSLRTAVKHIRRLGKFLGPASVAAALGLTAAELAEIIVADSSRTRRRMNPANIHALRRSMRRISSFHRLAQKADMLSGRRSTRRRTSVGKNCPPGIVQVR